MRDMKIYKSKMRKYSGTNYREVYRRARACYQSVASKTKRRPYIRSAYFNGPKIFLEVLWDHLWQKNWRDRVRRLKYYKCALDLIKNSRQEPISKQNLNKPSELLHRFAGLSQDEELFFVQVSEDKKTDQKKFLSVFPGG